MIFFQAPGRDHLGYPGEPDVRVPYDVPPGLPRGHVQPDRGECDGVLLVPYTK